MADKSNLILVSGLPASGKTSIARQMVEQFSIPLICRDNIKEVMFDSLGYSNLEWSRQLGIASWRILYHLIERFLAVGQPLIVETNFAPHRDLPKFQSLQATYDVHIAQIFCKTKPETLYKRFHHRALIGERHPGHQDHLISFEDFTKRFLQTQPEPLPLNGPVLEIDTTEFNDIDYLAIYHFIQTNLR